MSRRTSLGRAVLGVPIARAYTLVPGLGITAALAWSCTLLGRLLGKTPISAVTLAVFLGLIIGNTLPLPALLKCGITFSVKKVLKLGIILLGFRLSVMRVLELGAVGIPIVLVCVAAGLLMTLGVGRRMGVPRRLCTLIAVGTSICGVSAIVATAPAIGAREEETGYAVAVVTVFGLIATLVYPYAVHLMFGSDQISAGLFLGTAIHDTSQVTGAALIHAEVFDHPIVLGVATVTKLVRNLFMVAVIPLVAYLHARGGREGSDSSSAQGFLRFFPLFILGFLLLSALRSMGDATLGSWSRALGLFTPQGWANLQRGMKQWSVDLLVTALAGVGLSIRVSALRGLGIRPFMVGLGAAIAVGGTSLAAIALLGRFIPPMS